MLKLHYFIAKNLEYKVFYSQIQYIREILLFQHINDRLYNKTLFLYDSEPCLRAELKLNDFEGFLIY